MKIAMIGQKGIPATFGGVERHVEEISVRLAKYREYQVFVYARPYYTTKSKKTYKKVNIVNIPSIRTKHLDAISHTFFSTWHAMFTLKADVIHFHAIGPALCAWMPKVFKPSIKVVFTYHCRDYFHKKWGGFARLSLKLGEIIGCLCADEILAVSLNLKQFIKETYKRGSVYIPHGTSHEKHLPAYLIKKWGLRKDNYVFVVSRLIPHKGIHYLVEAFRDIKTNKKLVVAGAGFHTDNYEKSLKDMVKGDKRYLFVGNQKGRALKELYSNAYMMIHPSELEGLPLVVLEAASYGKALLLSDIPEHIKIFQKLPFFFVNKDIEDLTKQLRIALDQPSLVKQKGKSIKQYSFKHYDWDESLAKILSCYHQ